MIGKAQTNWVATLSVAVISAAIGFGAVYAMVAGSDNQARPQTQKIAGDDAKRPVTGSVRAERKAEADSGTVKGETVAVAQAPTSGAAFVDAGGQPVNRGRMATFVFKKSPMDLPDGATFNDGAGKAVGIDQFAGKVVLMNLWATWCAPCRKEMPDLDRLQAELGGDSFEVVAVSLDRGSADKARAFLNEIGVKSLDFYHDPDARLGFKLMAIGMPTTLLIDAKGREIGRLVGPAEWHSDDAKKLIKAVLAAQES